MMAHTDIRLGGRLSPRMTRRTDCYRGNNR